MCALPERGRFCLQGQRGRLPVRKFRKISRTLNFRFLSRRQPGFCQGGVTFGAESKAQRGSSNDALRERAPHPAKPTWKRSRCGGIWRGSWGFGGLVGWVMAPLPCCCCVFFLLMGFLLFLRL